MARAVYFIRRVGDECAIVKLHPDGREEIIADHLAYDEAVERCYAKLEELRRPTVEAGETRGPDIAPRRRRAQQLKLKL